MTKKAKRIFRIFVISVLCCFWGAVILFLFLARPMDETGWHRNYCSQDLAFGVMISDLIYRAEITTSTLDAHGICYYDIRLAQPLKTSLRYQLLGAPNIVRLAEAKQSHGTSESNVFWFQNDEDCRPAGNYLFFTERRHLEDLFKKRYLGIDSCNRWGVLPTSYEDDVIKLLKNPPQRYKINRGPNG